MTNHTSTKLDFSSLEQVGWMQASEPCCEDHHVYVVVRHEGKFYLGKDSCGEPHQPFERFSAVDEFKLLPDLAALKSALDECPPFGSYRFQYEADVAELVAKSIAAGLSDA